MATPRHIEPHIGARCAIYDPIIAALAGGQHGIVARWQLLDLGIGRRAVGHRLARERLHVIWPGVYAVGHELVSMDGRRMAAVLATGHTAALSHSSAATLWDVQRSNSALMHVTAPTHRRSRRGLQVHRGMLEDDETTEMRGIPVTTVARTLLDLAAALPLRQVERAFERAQMLRLADLTPLPVLLDRYPGRPGTSGLRQILSSTIGITRSELEERFLVLIRDAGLDEPRRNVHLHAGGRLVEVDCVWRDARLVVELDGYAYHAVRSAFESDRCRDRALALAGWTVVRVTWRQLDDDPRAVLADLADLIARGTSSPT